MQYINNFDIVVHVAGSEVLRYRFESGKYAASFLLLHECTGEWSELVETCSLCHQLGASELKVLELPDSARSFQNIMSVRNYKMLKYELCSIYYSCGNFVPFWRRLGLRLIKMATF